MAYAALTSLLQTLEQIPQPLQQITSLKEKVSRLLLILENSSQKISFTSRINHLEEQIRDASFEAEDIIESHISKHVLSRSISYRVNSFFLDMISGLQNMIPDIHLRQRLQEYVNQNMELQLQGLEKIIDSFDSILEALSKIKDGRVEDLRPRSSSSSSSLRVLARNKSTLVGLDEDLVRIKDRLTGSPSRLEVISIVGMGGIGKTTLARNLYNDSLIEHHFDTRAWIVVSQEYHLQEMLSSLLDSARLRGGELHHESIERLGELLHKSLKKRRYLIVIDDVWDAKVWDDVRRFFPDDNNGSRIILSTRLLEVATYASSDSHIHHMSLLNSEASWNLLCEKVFGEECCPFEFEKVGKKIAENCKGLPLAIAVISGLLSKGSKTENYWEYIAENVKPSVIGNDDQFMNILSLSYYSLPHHLKACFLYMGVYPEDYEISVSHLIKLWIAEGFVKPMTHKSLEDVAEDYLKDLVDRSLIMVHNRNHNGEIKTCIIHDLLRELCVKIAQDEKFLQIMGRSGCIFPEGRNNQRVSIHSNILHRLTEVNDSSIRTLLYFGERRSDNQFISFTVSSKLLRVLDVLTIRFYEFPIEIVELVHLRYLALNYRGKSKFPASISKLQNLQTLIVLGGVFTSIAETLYLPPTIWEMPRLRHLLFERTFLPYPFPTQTIGKDSVFLESLQTLSEVRNFICTRKVFEMMPNLKKLGISYFYDTHTRWSSYEFNNFVYLHQLETLKCLFIAKSSPVERPPLPVNFAFPPNLKKLTLSGSRISWKKMTIIGSLPNLEVLKLKDEAFEGPVWEPEEGEFSKLKFLLIHVSNLMHWRANDTHFPNLEHLSLSFCPYLDEIPSEIGEIPTLEMLELFECNPPAIASAISIQEEQHRSGNEILKVRFNSFRDGNYDSLRKVHSVLTKLEEALR